MCMHKRVPRTQITLLIDLMASTMAAPETDGVRPWADLPVEMVDAMVEHLDLFSTTRLAAVCTSWSTAVATNAALPFGTPCLLADEEDEDYKARRDDDEDSSYQLMDLTTKRGVSFPALIRNMRGQWWVGGKDDWLAVVDECSGARLLNPYTGRQIDLPRIAAAVDPIVIKIEGRAFDRIVVCATPDDEGYLVIGMINNYLLAMARRGDERWTVLRNPGGHLAGYKDAVVHKGKVFAVDRRGSIYAWDIRGGACTDPEVLQPPHLNRGELQQLQFENWKLAESADGRRLLLVCTYGEMVNRRTGSSRLDTYLSFNAKGVCVYERDGDGWWSPVTSLGDNSLFLGANYPFFARVGNRSTSDSDSEWRPVRPNCICFAEGNYFMKLDYDVGVFDLGAECQCDPYKLTLSNRGYYSSYQEPIWFRPKLKNHDLEQVAEDCI